MQVVIAVVTMETFGHPVMVDLGVWADCDTGHWDCDEPTHSHKTRMSGAPAF
jgi:hypothetical protein